MTSPPARHAGAHFPAEVTSAGGARRFVSATLADWHRADLVDVATLLVSELVGNVVLHARTALDVQVHQYGRCVRVEVHDRSRRLPDRKFYSSTSVTGRGLVLVGELADRWGAAATADGKVVWFALEEVALSGGASASVPAEFNFDDWDDVTDEATATAQEQVRATEARSVGLARAGAR